MGYDDYLRMLKQVCPAATGEQLYHIELLFSLGRGLMALEEMIPRSSRLLFQTGSIANSSQIPRSTPAINIVVDSSMIPAASYSARLNLIGMIQRKQHTQYSAQC